MSFAVDRNRLAELLRGMVRRKVLVVGDLMADEYVFAETSRVSREAPVLILRRVGQRVIPGGAGNAVLNLAALGAEPQPLGVVGGGEMAEAVTREFAARGIDVEGVVRDSARTTIRKTRVMAGGAHGQKQQVLRIDEEERRPLTEPQVEDLAVRALKMIETVEGVLFSDYGYGTVTPPLARRIVAAARRRGIPVCVDSRYSLRDYRGITYATPNEVEAAEAWGRPVRDAASLRAAAEALRKQLRAEFLLLTRGRDGMVVAEKEGGFTEIPIWGEAEAADVTGAGDTVAATSLLALLGGAKPVEAAWVASIAAGLVVQKHGAATTTREEMERVAGSGREDPIA